LRPRSFFTDAVNLEDRSGTIADVHHAVAIKCDPRRNAEIARERDCFFERIYSVDNAFESTAHKHLALRTKSNARRVWYVSGILGNVAAEIDSEERDRQLLASRSRARDKKRTVFRIECGIRNRMKIAGEFFPTREKGRFTAFVAT